MSLSVEKIVVSGKEANYIADTFAVAFDKRFMIGCHCDLSGFFDLK